MLQEGGLLPGPQSGLLSNTQNELSEETHLLTKQEILLGKGTRVESSRVRKPRRTALPVSTTAVARSLGFYGDGISFLVVFSQSSDSESFLVVHALFSQDGCQWEGFWEVVVHVVSPFDLSQTLPVGGGLLVACSSPGSPVLKQLMQIVTIVPGQEGWLQSVYFP